MKEKTWKKLKFIFGNIVVVLICLIGLFLLIKYGG